VAETDCRSLSIGAKDDFPYTFGHGFPAPVCVLVVLEVSMAVVQSVESYTVVTLLTFILIISSIPSPLTLSFQA